MKKRLSKTLWYGTDVDSFGSPMIPPFTADPHDLDGLHVGELFLHYSGGMATLWTANESGNVVKVSGGEGGVDLSPYLLISEFNKIWEIRTDSQGAEYIFGKLPVVTQYGITMYSGEDVDIPTIAEGLPFDNRTIWFNPTTKQIEVIGGTGGGSGEGVSNFWDLNGIPSWITNTKPTYGYSEIEGTPDLSKYALVSQIPSLSGYATEQWVLGKNYLTSISSAMIVSSLGYTPYDGNSNPKGFLTEHQSLDEYVNDIATTGDGNAITNVSKSGKKITFTKGATYLTEHQDLSGYQPLITSANKLAYALISGTPDLSVYALKSAIPSLNGYATESWVLGKGYATVSDLDGRINALINGAPAAFNTLKEIADVLQGNVNSIGDIITTLGTKADKATTLSGYGITDAYTKTNVDNLLKAYVTLAGTQTVTGEKDFTGGLKVNGSPLVYDSRGFWKIEGDLIVTGGVSMYSSDTDFTPSTIMDGVVVDGVTIRKNPTSGALEFIGSVDGGTASSVAWSNITGKPDFATVATSGRYSDLSGLPTIPTIPSSLKNPYSLTFGSKTYDGSSAKTILASDLGALTSHQSIYALTIKNSAGTTQLTYTPNTGAGSITLTNAMVGLGNVENTALSTWVGTNKITTLGTITSGTWNGTKIANSYLANSSISISGTSVSLGGSITQAALRTALGLGSNAYTSTEFLPLSGGILENSNGSPLRINSTHPSGGAIVFLQDGDNKAWFGYNKDVGRTYMYNTVSDSYLAVRDDGKPYFNSNILWHNGNDGAGSGLDADLLDGYETHYGLLRKGSASFSDTTNSVWYVKIVFTSSYNNKPNSVYIHTDYNNVGGFVTLNLESYAQNHGYIAKVSNYNGCNCTGFSYAQDANNSVGKNRDTLWLRFVGNESASAQVYCTGYILESSKLSASEVSAVSFVDLTDKKQHILTNYTFNASSATKLQTARTLWGQPFDGSEDVNGAIVMNNSTFISMKDTRRSDRSILNFDGLNRFFIGNGTSSAGYDTYINGNNIYLRYGTSHTTGLTLNNSGDISIDVGSLTIPNNKGIRLKNTEGTSYSVFNLNSSNYLNIGVDTASAGYQTNIYGYSMNLRCGSSKTGLHINSSGNITIGSSDLASTAYKLYVDGNVKITNRLTTIGDIYKYNSNSSYRLTFIHDANEARIYNISESDGSYGTLLIGSPAVAQTLCYKDGNWGIGTTSPSAKLHVAGDILATGGVTLLSARKLKNVIDERGLSFEELSVIKPTRFTWKDGRDSKIHIGGIADDVMKVLPEVIYKTEDNTLTMDYGNAAFAISASLIKPVISHEERIKLLEEENKRLKEEIEILKWNIA